MVYKQVNIRPLLIDQLMEHFWPTIILINRSLSLVKDSIFGPISSRYCWPMRQEFNLSKLTLLENPPLLVHK